MFSIDKMRAAGKSAARRIKAAFSAEAPLPESGEAASVVASAAFGNSLANSAIAVTAAATSRRDAHKTPDSSAG